MWKILEKRQIWPDWGNTAWEDMAGLGSKELTRTPIKTPKDDKKWPLFVKQTAVLVVCINNIGQ